MYVFLDVALSFPVVIFSFALSLVVIYWLLVCSGILDSEPLDIDMHAASAYDQATTLTGLEMFFKSGKSGVPFVIYSTLVSLIGWLISYSIHLLLFQRLSFGFFYYPLGFVSGLASLLIAITTTTLIVRLSKPLIMKIKGPQPKPVFGKVAIVRSATVTRTSGMALLEDGGAGLILQVRSIGADEIRRNERIVILQYIADEHVYHVISENEFMG